VEVVDPEAKLEPEAEPVPEPEPEPEPEPVSEAPANVDEDLEALKEQMRREAEEAAAVRRAAEEEMAAAAKRQADALEKAMADKALATSTLLQEMTEIRLELAQAEKGFSDKLHGHSETIDGQIKHLEAELHEQLPEVAAVRESLVTLKDTMQDKVDKEALERLEQIIAANAGSLDGSQPTQSVPELTGILGAIDEMKSGLSSKADLDMLQRMETQLLQQVHDLIAKVAEEAAGNQRVAEPADSSPSQEALETINGMLADLAALREELTFTQAKLSEAEQKAIDHAAETARMFFNAKQQEMEEMLKALQADQSQSDENSVEPLSVPAPAVDLDGLVHDEQLREGLDTKADVAYCDELFHQLEEQLQEFMQNQSGTDNAVMSSGSTELKIFKRSWWETMQAQINQKASNRDIQQLRAQIAQLQAAQAGDASSRPSTRGSMSRARTPISGVPRPTAGDGQPGVQNPTGEAGTGRLVNAANASVADSLPGGKKGATLSSAEPQMHVVVGEFPSKVNPRMSRSLGGGAVALRADDEIVFLQNRLEEKLTVLKKMYDNKGWGVRGATVLNAASMLAQPLDMSRGGLPSDASKIGALPTRSLWSRNSHQRAMKRIGGAAGAGPSGSGSASALGRRQLYPMDYSGGTSGAGMGMSQALPFRSITGQVSPIGKPVNSHLHRMSIAPTYQPACAPA
jgi:hypothetical protein